MMERQSLLVGRTAKRLPLTFDYLSRFQEVSEEKIKYKPIRILTAHNSRSLELFQSEKIITPYLSKRGQMSIDKDGEFFE